MYKTISILSKVPNVPDDYYSLHFGRQLDFSKDLQNYKNTAKQIYLSQKGRSHTKAMKEFKALYKPKNYFVPPFACDPNRYDDSFLVYYTN